MHFVGESKEVITERFSQMILLSNEHQLDHCNMRERLCVISNHSPMRLFAIQWILKVSFVVTVCTAFTLSRTGGHFWST